MHKEAAAPFGWSDIPSTANVSHVPFQENGGPPFVIFDDARSSSQIRIYRNPSEIVETSDPTEIKSCLRKIQAAVDGGSHAAGFLSYGAGFALEPRLAPLLAVQEEQYPLLWFGLFENAEIMPTDVLQNHAAQEGIAPVPAWSEREYLRAVRRVQDYIAAGDCYQVNLTFDAMVSAVQAPFALYGRMRGSQKAGWGGMLFDGRKMLLSASPELFFAVRRGKIWVRPMKGTAPRNANRTLDEKMRTRLACSKKDRAENLMIVDLLRNDLSRISQAGSVQVPGLFDIESYPTVFQMTSTVTADLQEGIKAADIITALFPCGSVTGAPKIRAMEIINELERPRRAYTGSMGFIEPDGTSAFNVLIRTIELDRDRGIGTMGLGSAIVADSDPKQEWAECLTKMRFVQ